MKREEQLELAAKLGDEGWGVVPPEQHRIDIESEFLALWERISSFTMTSFERAYSLYRAVMYLIDRDIQGDFVECGVWRGGSCMLIAHTLIARQVTDRNVHLYDTFTGMTEPSDEDTIAWNHRSVKERFERFESWAVGLPEVEKNLKNTGYPAKRMRFIQGDVLETLEQDIPDSIALLRLDTDWYRSTAHELEVLYPRLVTGGVLIIDDYGHFEGARKAVDEYFSDRPAPLLSRVDYTGRVGVKL